MGYGFKIILAIVVFAAILLLVWSISLHRRKPAPAIVVTVLLLAAFVGVAAASVVLDEDLVNYINTYIKADSSNTAQYEAAGEKLELPLPEGSTLMIKVSRTRSTYYTRCDYAEVLEFYQSIAAVTETAPEPTTEAPSTEPMTQEDGTPIVFTKYDVDGVEHQIQVQYNGATYNVYLTEVNNSELNRLMIDLLPAPATEAATAPAES